MLIWAPSWAWVLLANLLLGISQGLTWSTTVVMKIDLVGPARRGFAMGLNEAMRLRRRGGDRAGHRLPGGRIRPATRPVPPRTRLRRPRARALRARGPRDRDHARLEAAGHRSRSDGKHDHLHRELTDREVFTQTDFREAGAVLGS